MQISPVAVTRVGELRLQTPTADGARFISAASGLIGVGSSLWAVSDDRPELVRISGLDGCASVHPALPPRATKYDLEAITAFPAAGARDAARGASLVAFGSGSKADRAAGILQDVDAAGSPVGAPRPIDFAPLYSALSAAVPMGLNLEGAALRDGRTGHELVLLHRGKLDGDANTVFVVDADAVIRAARSGAAVPASALRSSHTVELGRLNGERLAFSDAHALADGRIAFVASAESGGALGNGKIVGSAVGVLDETLTHATLRPLAGPARKVEGIEHARVLDPAAPADRFVAVTDADDDAAASELLTFEL